ncbi:SixA phosphatase family protein [Agromyces bauzanensis]|uniref:Phosphoglycerate mutase n=1 Tax=Agromyces bauzanensis TaxID=1308924 RepID=A0A917PEM2_9MICO|nr:histidine phosphatase family protein [Agromyces bauzanensis]GGJ73328.1 phosphoglycerate mutase [Agromyces bauzanensis]
MKTLVLVRHAKSSWDHPGLADHERPLNDRGRRDAPRMGRRLASRGLAPDLILSSTAVRALTTAELIAQALGIDRDGIVADERLYATSASGLLGVIGEVESSVGTAFVVGHNPEMTSLVHRFTDEIGHMPTCAVAEFRFEADAWNELDEGLVRAVRFDTPRS